MGRYFAIYAIFSGIGLSFLIMPETPPTFRYLGGIAFTLFAAMTTLAIIDYVRMTDGK